MINEGGFLESLAMRSSEAATGTRTATPARSISTTTGPTMTTTMSASADPKITCLDIELAHGKSILGRESPGEIPKARQQAKPKTAAGLTSAAAESGNIDVLRLIRFEKVSDGAFWKVGGAGRRSGHIGQCIAIIALRHSNGYEIVLKLQDEKIDTFTPFDLYPAEREVECAA